MKIEDFPPIFDAGGELTAFGITVKKLMLEILADDCKHELNWICAINEGDEEGRGATILHQCRKCKTITVK